MIKALNLDPNFEPTTFNALNFDAFKFNGGEQHFKFTDFDEFWDNDEICEKREYCETVIITHRIKNGDDIMQVLMAADACRKAGITNLELVMPYIPYARQDRLCDRGEAFSLKVFANLINSVGFNKVTVFDAHSDVATALINNCINLDNQDYVELALLSFAPRLQNLLLISPDAGSNKKIQKFFPRFSNHFKRLIKCDKRRDTKTGALLSFEVFSGGLGGIDCLIVDDICDGGGTFIGLAKELKLKSAGDIYLFVSHGIFSKGFAKLSKHFKHIYTTNSFNDINWINQEIGSGFVTQFKLSI